MSPFPIQRIGGIRRLPAGSKHRKSPDFGFKRQSTAARWVLRTHSARRSTSWPRRWAMHTAHAPFGSVGRVGKRIASTATRGVSPPPHARRAHHRRELNHTTPHTGIGRCSAEVGPVHCAWEGWSTRFFSPATRPTCVRAVFTACTRYSRMQPCTRLCCTTQSAPRFLLTKRTPTAPRPHPRSHTARAMTVAMSPEG